MAAEIETLDDIDSCLLEATEKLTETAIKLGCIGDKGLRDRLREARNTVRAIREEFLSRVEGFSTQKGGN